MTDPLAAAKGTAAHLRDHPIAYLSAGLSATALILAITVGSSAILFAAMAPGIYQQDEMLVVIGSAVGSGIHTLVLTASLLIILPPLQASLIREAAVAFDGEGEMGLMSPFRRARDADGRIQRVVVLYALINLGAAVGMLLLFVPGLIVAGVGAMAFPIVVFEEVGPIEALKRAWDHAKRHAAWHVVQWLVMYALVSLVQLTVVGIVVMLPLMSTYQALVYREAFGTRGSGADDAAGDAAGDAGADATPGDGGETGDGAT